MSNESLSVTIFAEDYGSSAIVDDIVPKLKRNNIRKESQEAHFEETYQKYLHRVISFAHFYLNDMDEAQNVAHDVFLSFWHTYTNIESKENVLAYLIASTKNKCLNIIRKRGNERKYTSMTTQNKAEQLKLISLEDDLPSQLFETEIEMHLCKAIEKMKPKVRRTFVLSRFNGFKNREIAEMEGIAESTVEARISSALLVLRKIFKDYME